MRCRVKIQRLIRRTEKVNILEMLKEWKFQQNKVMKLRKRMQNLNSYEYESEVVVRVGQGLKKKASSTMLQDQG